MKKITIVTTYPLSSEPVIKNRLQPMIDIALDAGYEVNVVSGDCAPVKLSISDSFNSIFIEKPDYGRGFIERAWREYKHSTAILKKVKEVSEGIIVITIPSMFLLFNTRILSAAKVCIDVRDLTWEYLPDKNPVYRLAKFVFKIIARKRFHESNFIAVTNDTEYSTITSDYGQPFDKVIKNSNGVSNKQFRQLKPLQQKSMVGKRRLTVTYAGNVGIAQNLTVLLDAAELLPEVDFVIAGAGTDHARIEAYSKTKKLKNVRILGRVDWSEIPSLYCKTDILYAQLSREYSGAMPSKLYEYLSTGKYIIYGGIDQAQRILKEFDNNIVIEPDNPMALVDAIKNVADKALYQRISIENSEKIEREYIREKSTASFFEKLGSKL